MENSPQRPARLLSLDALRGFDMFWIMSGEQIAHSLARTTHWPPFVWLSDQLHHTVWDGFTFYDMIFPLFLFIAGVSLPFSMPLPVTDKKRRYKTMLRRTLTLIVLGLVVNGILKWNGYLHIRFASVLGRIGIAWFLAALIYMNCSLRGQIIWFAGLLLGYWALMMWVPVPGYGAGVLTMQGSLESYIDRLLLPGRLHDTVHDPEGILSTLPAIGTALLGIFTGRLLRLEHKDWPMIKKGAALFLAGLVLLGAGLLWGQVFPINKRLWSSSFVLYAGGWSLLLLSVFYLVIDVAGLKRWAFPFVVIGVNSIAIYLASEGLIDFAHTADYLFGGLIRLTPTAGQIVWTAVSVTLFNGSSCSSFTEKRYFSRYEPFSHSDRAPPLRTSRPRPAKNV